MTPLSSLVGARIRRIDAPDSEILALTLYAPELRTVLLFCLARARAGVGLVATRPHGLAATSFVQKLRKELENGRILAFEQPNEHSLQLSVSRSLQTLSLTLDFGTAACVRLARVDDDATLIKLDLDARTGKPPRLHWPQSIEDALALGEVMVAGHGEASLNERRSQLDQSLRATEKRLKRRLGALDEDITRAEQAEPLRMRANLLLAAQRDVQRGQTSVQVIDYTVDPPAPLEITLDPARTLKEQVEAWFKQARRYERGAVMATERKHTTERELSLLDELRVRVSRAALEDLDHLATEARALGARGTRDTGKSSKRTKRRKPYREFEGAKQRTILVGKGAADNDSLTLEHARPHDLWLHARSVAGAHVVVPLDRNETCPDELLLDAAHLAAHFSAARGEAHVDVSYVARRYVRKPRGAAAGSVDLEREKVIALVLEPTRLTRLLGQERSD
ncbi:MAG: NFACT RNA binding domain-containing protein [Polyangiales bacterium]